MRNSFSPTHSTLLLATLLVIFGATNPSLAQIDFERQPINYDTFEPSDPVALLKRELDAGRVSLEADDTFGYLKSLLKQLQISPDSQTLVFTKTSFQIRKISPYRPRALYFNDEVYAGWVQGSDIIELAATDPENGAVFYTLEKDDFGKPALIRDRGQCLSCHANYRTKGVPGFVMRSIYPTDEGRFVSGAPTYTLDHNSEFQQRWGGWYVTGNHGSLQHLGNATCSDKNDFKSLNRDNASNISDLASHIATRAYLRPTSDIVALLLLEHQTQMHNLITRASYEARSAKHHDDSMNKILERPEGFVSDTTKRRISKASEKLLRYMLFVDAPTWDDQVSGNPAFQRHFESQGPSDSRGRSLRHLDLKTRLLRYPLSYLVYSKAFDNLPDSVKQHLGSRMNELLVELKTEDSQLLPKSLAAEIKVILRETKPDFWDSFVEKDVIPKALAP